MTLLLAAAGFSVDLGRAVVVNRSLQLVADNAALDAGRYLTIPETVSLPNSSDNLIVHADNSATNNGSTAAIAVTQGIWNATVNPPTFTPESSLHCKAQSPPNGNVACNAVEVTASTSLARLLSHGTSAPSRTAIAEVTPEAGFSIGTYLGSYNAQQTALLGPLLNTLGASSDLTLVGFGGLAGSEVTLQQLINASGGVLTPQNVMSVSATGANWDSYLSKAVSSQAALLNCTGSNQPGPCYASAPFSQFASTSGVNSSVSMQLCQFVSINGSSCGTQLPQAALSASLNVLQTITSEAELANGNNGIDVTSALNLSNGVLGLLPVSLTINLIKPPQVAYGPIGTTATTGQVSASLAVTVPAGLGTAVLTIPVTAASGTATLTTVTCSASSLYNAKLTASTTTSGPNSVTLSGTQVATLTVTGTPATNLGFFAGVVPPTPSTVSAKSNPQWLSTTNPTLVFGSQAGGLTPLVGALLNTTLPLVLTPALQSLGVTLAGAAVADLGTTCAAVSLVK
jgi:uncharacterized membrane protein